MQTAAASLKAWGSAAKAVDRRSVRSSGGNSWYSPRCTVRGTRRSYPRDPHDGCGGATQPAAVLLPAANTLAPRARPPRGHYV
eukprot:362523-Chlamydomonas_euryale.AAC.3